jgi:hypothetical protein
MLCLDFGIVNKVGMIPGVTALFRRGILNGFLRLRGIVYGVSSLVVFSVEMNNGTTG